jgi:hypothetical protein
MAVLKFEVCFLRLQAKVPLLAEVAAIAIRQFKYNYTVQQHFLFFKRLRSASEEW